MEKAKTSLEVHVGIKEGQLWHQDATYELDDAYTEKQEKRRRKGLRDYLKWETIKHIQDSDDSDSDSDEDAPVDEHAQSITPGSPPPRDINPSPDPPSPSPSSDHESHDEQVGVVTYEQLQARWSRATREARAAPVSLIPGPSTQHIPSGMETFVYCEQHYVRPSALELPSPDFLAGCDCRSGCKSIGECCCATEPTNDDSITRACAYNKSRRFKFDIPPGTVVTECNNNCNCPKSCRNRVAQRPRDVPLEVFHTGQSGWGVRATISIPIGKVLGVYTGKLVEYRDVAEEHRSYIFDLDVCDPPSYSVDSYQHGNWSRFVNHSCEPNLQVYPVVWDTVPELHQPYLAFVATTDIPARTELTIDYSPKLKAQPQKAKGKTRAPDGAKPCRCGALQCRGWLAV
ncbi:SET domain-containing protein [Fomitopsis betulina]|nr:SET domain-containing protein [Fomitopsis betulina]